MSSEHTDNLSYKVTHRDLVFGRTVVPVPNPNEESKKGKLGYEYAEHCFIGDAITLTLANGRKVAASRHKFKFPNGLNLSYGQINGLAGDFYGTDDPISDGKDDADRSARFVKAYNTLAKDTSRQPREALKILGLLSTEVDAVNKALANHQDPSVVYAKLPDISLKLDEATWGRPSGQRTYIRLALINWDHFGIDARTAYNAGHATALQAAIDGDLEEAYAMNAFADHYLEDSFSAGHLRTPRRLLHHPINVSADACSKYMHDEDNAIGISVQNPAGESWMMYGDKRALDYVDLDNKNRCVKAVQASADEIYKAYLSKKAPSSANYQAWAHAPTLESARAHQTLASLFTFEKGRRKVIVNRRLWDFKTNWWFATTLAEIIASGWWKYPFDIDGPKKTIPWSSVAATAPRTGHVRVFYQDVDGGILESEHLDGDWRFGASPESTPIFKAVLFTPLAAINLKQGEEVHVYYLDEQYILQEYCYSVDRGTWFPGSLGELRIQAATNSSIAATQWVDEGGVHIRVYLQGAGSDAIKEVCYDGYWYLGVGLPEALSGSQLSAVSYLRNGLEIRVYYQADDLSIKEHCLDETGWHPGDFNPGKAPGCVPISASGFIDNGDVQLHVYWRNLDNEIIGLEYSNSSWANEPTKVVGQLKAGTQFAATHWENGGSLRVYYQAPDDSIVETVRDDTGVWLGGNSIGGA